MGHVTIKTKVIALAVLVVGVIGSYNVSVKGLLQKDTQTQTVDTVLEFQREILRRDIARYPVEVMLENAKHQIVQKEEAATGSSTGRRKTENPEFNNICVE